MRASRIFHFMRACSFSPSRVRTGPQRGEVALHAGALAGKPANSPIVDGGANADETGRVGIAATA
jgi:hypothetical protein